MIYLSEGESPLGPLGFAECRQRLLAVAYGGKEGLLRLREPLLRLGGLTDSPVRSAGMQLLAYLEGAPRGRFVLDLSLISSPFDRQVLTCLYRQGQGLTTYGELARKIGRPQAARAVGGAMRRNPLPIVIPCHRVVPSQGGLGNYTGGIERKRWLLAHEGLEIAANGSRAA